MKELLKALAMINFDDIDYDALFDARESGCFDSEWMRVYNAVKALKNEENHPQSMKLDVSDIRETAFKEVYSRCDYCDIAEYISDDFGLIADAALLGYKDVWLDKLIACYREKRIPCGEL